MACCEEKQTECLKVVNIAYLKTFIGDDVHSSIDNTAIKINGYDDKYCPTYGELTNGLIIQTGRTDASNPFNDVDGIKVNSTFRGGSASVPYTNDQVVNKQDLSLIYTRFGTLSISLGKTTGLNACSGESTTVTTTHNYKRYTKTMTDCTGGNPTTTSTTVNGSCTNVEWSTKYGTVTNCNTYTIDKNPTDSSRTDTVKASVKWRGTTNTSNVVNVTQLAPAGGGWVEVNKVITRELTRCTPSPSTLKITGTTSGDTYIMPEQEVTLAAISSETTVTNYKWVDGCGIEDGRTSATTTTSSGNTSVKATFKRTETKCCNIPATGLVIDMKTLMISFGEESCSKTFSAICASCSGTSACEEPHPEECNKIVGYNDIYCSGTYQYEIGPCSEPDPIHGVRTMDNMGQICYPRSAEKPNGRPTCSTLLKFANPTDCGWYDEAAGIPNWWTGPKAAIDGTSDSACTGVATTECRCGYAASAWTETTDHTYIGDSCRYNFNDNGYWPRDHFDLSKATTSYTSYDNTFIN